MYVISIRYIFFTKSLDRFVGLTIEKVVEVYFWKTLFSYKQVGSGGEPRLKW